MSKDSSWYPIKHMKNNLKSCWTAESCRMYVEYFSWNNISILFMEELITLERVLSIVEQVRSYVVTSIVERNGFSWNKLVFIVNAWGILLMEEFFPFKNVSRTDEQRKLCLKLYKDSFDRRVLHLKEGSQNCRTSWENSSS